MYQGLDFYILCCIIYFSFVEPDGGDSLTLAANENRNNFRIDSIEATGDCCWEIESNDGDYETVDPKNPADINIFYIHKIIVFNSCPQDYQDYNDYY